jgi:DNA mismatch endonuclease, patch repair protein
MGTHKSKVYIRDNRSPTPKNESVSKVMSANKAKNTKPEIILRKKLWEANVRGYRIAWKKLPGSPDLAFPAKKIAIFVNGCFWHRCEKCNPRFPKTNIEFWTKKFSTNKLRDIRKTEELISLGWTVFTVWECEIKYDVNNIVEMVITKFS